ncbi:MAG: hypothetical protein ACFE9Q_12080 [Candidatus Hodarchaeota archaeon]
MYGFSSLWFSIGLTRIFFYFSDYLLEGTYTGDIESIFQSNNLLFILIYYFYVYLYIYLFVNIIILCFIFIWFSIKLKAEFKAISSMMAIGFTTFLIGWIFEATPLKSLNLMVPGISSLLIFFGVIIAASPLILNLEFFYRPLANWTVITLISCILIFLGLTIFTNVALSVISLIIIWISASVLVLVIVYVIMNMVKRARAQEISSQLKKEKLKDVLTIFTKPQTITEEELNTYREQKICLVCKSKVSRLNYVCPKCDVLYCIRCSKALIKLENVCWVCDTPIDISEHIPVLEVKELLKETDVVSDDEKIEFE